MLDRTIQPPVKAIEDITIIEPQVIKTDNGIDIHILDMGEQEVVRIDLMFNLGKWNQNKLLVAMMTNLLLKEGVEGMNSKQIAEALDFYGAWLHPSATFHNSYVTLYSLNKHIAHTLPLLEKIIKSPTFPEYELDVVRSQRKHNFIIDNEKVSVKAFNLFVDKLFGNQCPYGHIAHVEDFDAITRDDLVAFHKSCYSSDRCTIVVTGRVTDEILASIKTAFCSQSWGEKTDVLPVVFEPHPAAPGVYLQPKEDALQTAVRIGLPTINRQHADYPKLRVLNTLLGGYFGSRLMMNIREDKGYTYGIGSSLTTLKYASYLSIATETANEYRDALVQEVKNEMIRLQTELVGEQELLMLKGYLMGEMARLFDGPFSIADAHIALLANDMQVSYYHDMIRAIKEITAEEIRELSIQYLNVEQLFIVMVGQD